MATANKHTETTVVNTYTLADLTEDEASVIMALVGSVGGRGKYRDASGRVYQALKKTGLTTTNYGTTANMLADKVPYFGLDD